jgi:type II secretory pathway pseudopilin PulG
MDPITKMDMHRRKVIQSAFSLVELIVSMAILTFLVIITTSAYQSVVSGYSRIADQARQRDEARSVLLLMSDEIRSTLTPIARSPGVVIANMGTAGASLDFLINPPALSATADGQAYANPHTIFWQAPTRDGVAGSALLGYAVKWETRSDGTPVPVLRRLRSDSGRMFKELSDAATGATTWAGVPLLSELAPATATNAYKGWMSENVLALWVRALDPMGNPITKTASPITGVTAVAGWPASTFGSASNSGGAFDSKLGYQYSTPAINRFSPALPSSVEIAITTLPPSVLKKLAAPQRPSATMGVDPALFWTDIDSYVAGLPGAAKAAAKTYSTIIPLSGGK